MKLLEGFVPSFRVHESKQRTRPRVSARPQRNPAVRSVRRSNPSRLHLLPPLWQCFPIQPSLLFNAPALHHADGFEKAHPAEGYGQLHAMPIRASHGLAVRVSGQMSSLKRVGSACGAVLLLVGLGCASHALDAQVGRYLQPPF